MVGSAGNSLVLAVDGKVNRFSKLIWKFGFSSKTRFAVFLGETKSSLIRLCVCEGELGGILLGVLTGDECFGQPKVVHRGKGPKSLTPLSKRAEISSYSFRIFTYRAFVGSWYPSRVVVNRFILSVVLTSRLLGVSSVMILKFGVGGQECGGDKSISSLTIAISVPGR
ncbi:hypothetical protein TNIN_161941 [Trichonephila inaurata madagascariensis]|uniref:Uncharacterized protein n=1 Tax=Trichonephila inaurata madagascariensis TaxID=2747483 RepID=A0A8X7C5K7_9ARAC|nr:hypothetical protein TNIN_161941 [Trichonephila inaurata madagascariensis]